MRMKRTATTAARTGIVLAAAIALLAGCSSTAEPADDETDAPDYGPLSLQLSFVKNTQNAGEYMADSEGFYTEAGFESVTLVAGPTAVEASVATEKSNVGFSTALGTATAITQEDMPLKIIGSVYAQNAFTIMSMEGENAIEQPADLAGKRIGVTAGTARSLVEAFATANDVDPAEITFVPAEGNTALLTSGEVDGYFGLETNELLVLQLAGEKVVSLPLATNGLPLAGTSFVVTQDAIENDRELVKAFLVAEIRGWAAAIADPDAGAELAISTYGKDLGLNPAKEKAQAKAQVANVLTPEAEKSGLFLLTKEQMTANIEALELVGIDIAAKDLFDMTLLQEVYDENPDLLTITR